MLNKVTPSYNKIESEHARTIVVGDIHGCYNEFQELLNKVSFCESDLLVSVGDMVDRGPSSWAVAGFFKENANAYSVMGNHERKIAGVIRGVTRPAWSQLHALAKISKKDHAYWADYFDTLPAVLETKHAIITHARIDASLSLDKQDPYFTSAVGGSGIKIECDDRGIPFWFLEWRKRDPSGKPVCFGHLFYERIELVPGALFALDTGAVMGKDLTAIVFPGMSIVSVKCQTNQWALSRQEWLKAEIAEFSPEHFPIYKYFAIKKKGAENAFDENMLHVFDEFMASQNIEKRVKQLRRSLMKRFGEIPANGAEKGEYFKRLKKQTPEVNQRLVNMIIREKPFEIESFLKLFAGGNLFEAKEEWAKLERFVNRSSNDNPQNKSS